MVEGEPVKLDLQRWEGCRRVFESSDPELVIIEFTDVSAERAAADEARRPGKGAASNAVSARVLTHLVAEGVPTYFVKKLSDVEQLAHALELIPFVVTVRNAADGEFARSLGLADGDPLHPTVVEWCYKSHEVEPLPIGNDLLLALGYVSEAELAEAQRLTHRINDVLTLFFAERRLRLVGFSLEFGKTREGKIVVAGPLSPDALRLWDMATGERLDEELLRRNLGPASDAYEEVLRRVFYDQTG